MNVQEIMERVGTNSTGRAIAYLKDALEEINMLAETHITTARIDIVKDKRFYDLPKDMIKMLDIRCKNQLNGDNEYRSLPRAIGKPTSKDSDGN